MILDVFWVMSLEEYRHFRHALRITHESIIHQRNSLTHLENTIITLEEQLDKLLNNNKKE